MSKAVQRRRGTTAEHTTFTGALGELTVDTTKDTLVVHDGAAAGGFPLLREDGSNSALALGSAGTPSLKFTGDPNTGLYSPGADQVAVATNGTERLRITSAGLVGIGTSSPSFTAHVSGAKNTSQLFIDAPTISAANDYAQIGLGLGGTAFGLVRLGFDNPSGVSNSYLSFYNNSGSSNVERMRIDSSGRVGIGTTSPSAKLQVAGASGTSTTANLLSLRNESASNAGNLAQIDFFCSNTFGGNEAVAAIQALNPNASANNGGALVLAVSSNGTATTPSERARIDSSGRLLVGTSSFFEPNGEAKIEAKNGSIAIGTFANSAGQYSLSFVKSRGVSSNVTVQVDDYVGAVRFWAADGTGYPEAAMISAQVDGTPGANDMPGRLVFSTTADGAASPTERLRIDSAGVLQVADAGNIAVGTTTGTKIGTATTQKLGFFNKTPVVQPAAVANATDAASVITQLNALLARMRDLGLIAT